MNEQVTAQAQVLMRLALDINSCFTSDEVRRNFTATVGRGYQPLNGLLNKERGTCSVVGSAPSIEKTHKELRGDCIAINSALPYLLDKGIVPKYAMMWDAHELVEKFAQPHPQVTYLLASRCHPKVFERLQECAQYVWHAAGDHQIFEWTRDEAPEPYPVLINGGTAGVTRGIYLANVLGYKEIHIYGADSSYSEDGATHIRGSVVNEKDTVVSLGCAPPLFFRTTPEWCQQVNEYKVIYALFAKMGVPLEVHGDGLLPTLHQILKAQKEHFGMEKFLQRINDEFVEQADMDAKATAGEGNIVPIKTEAIREPNYAT